MTGWWQWLEQILETAPCDVGCDETMAVLDVYVELLASGVDVVERYPGVVAHLAGCESCSAITFGLLAAVKTEDSDI